MSLKAKAALAAGLVFTSAFGAFTCTDDIVHVFGAYRYEPDNGCLEAAAGVDVIEGPDPGTCPGVRCWISAAGDVYVTSTACDAPSDYTEHTKDPPGSVCADAIAALAAPNESLCPPDGGSLIDAEIDADAEAGIAADADAETEADGDAGK